MYSSQCIFSQIININDNSLTNIQHILGALVILIGAMKKVNDFLHFDVCGEKFRTFLKSLGEVILYSFCHYQGRIMHKSHSDGLRK